ncbi:MAG: hypothetical protein PHV37_02155 [Candidatus Gastranaerophilales bacterium]|nr:hypothetical protein [Candidatus Gastranaerophilales bacterium]
MLDNRWYDSNKNTRDALILLKKLDFNSQNVISSEIINIANSIKSVRKEQESLPLSIGLKRVLGLYQSNQARRWYDKSEKLNEAFQVISLLPEEDFSNIMEGICASLQN